VLTDEELTLIYNEANGIPPGRTGRTPITTERIFTAMRAAMLAEREAMQARIDELMLEYYPQEMTDEQRERWAANQRVVLDERSAFNTPTQRL